MLEHNNFCTFSTYSDLHSLHLSESPTGLSSIYVNLWVLMHYYAYKVPLNTLERAVEQLDPKRDPEIQHSRSKYNSEYSIRWRNCFKLYISPCQTPTHHPPECVPNREPWTLSEIRWSWFSIRSWFSQKTFHSIIDGRVTLYQTLLQVSVVLEVYAWNQAATNASEVKWWRVYYY